MHGREQLVGQDQGEPLAPRTADAAAGRGAPGSPASTESAGRGASRQHADDLGRRGRGAQSVERAAGLPEWGPHALKHTFCPHLAMRGAAPPVLKDRAAHKHVATTMRYLHLSRGATDGAIRLLDRGRVAPRGDIVETEDQSIGKECRRNG